MASKKIKWPSNAILTRKSNATYYSHFIATSNKERTNNESVYKLGDCVSIKVNRRISVMLAEIVELFVDDSISSDEEEEDLKDKVAIRLYALPEDTPNGRNHNHGEIVLSCYQFLSMEQASNSWSCGVPLQPVSDHPLPPSPAPSTSSSLLYCYEPMVPIGLFEYEEQMGLSPCSSPIPNRLTPPTSPNDAHPRIKVVSELVYCRYCAVLARFGTDSAYQYMSLPRVKTLGGLPVPSVTTKIMFCKRTFRDINLERKLDYCISKSVAFSVLKNRRPSSSVSPSPPSTTSSDTNPSLTTSNEPAHTKGGRNNRTTTAKKRGRGRPRKDGSSTYDSPLKHKRPSDNDTYVSPSKKPNMEVATGSLIGCKRGRGELELLSCKQAKVSLVDIGSASGSMVAQPSAIAGRDEGYRSHDVKIESQRSGECEGDGRGTVYSSSGTSLVDSDTLVHSLRPRSALLPPPQFRDECYDMQMSPNNDPNQHEPQTDQPTSNETLTTPTKDPATIKPKISVLSQAELTQDVQELLKAYLFCLRQVAAASAAAGGNNDSTSSSESINTHLETHLINEKQFLDLLFCFMKYRKTPIHRVPRLGSRNLNLFELYKVTMTLGGYEQVTINRKWSHVFDSLGCAAGMTCASTVTRKHYEKLLLPFERALNAMKK